jgi:glucoamylase
VIAARLSWSMSKAGPRAEAGRTLEAAMPRRLALVASIAVLAAGLTAPGAAAARRGAPAPAGPGTAAHFDLARKDCVGTARDAGSKVWFTVAGGVLSDVYEPTIDTTNVESMRFVVTDGRTFTELQGRDTTYTVSTDGTGMACTVTTASKAGRYRLVTTYITDPGRDAVVMRTRLLGGGRTGTGATGTGGTGGTGGGGGDLRLYVRLDASVGGNGGGGEVNGGADTGTVAAGVPVVSDENTTTNAANRDYARPTHLALTAARPLPEASVGFAGTAGDGLSMLDTDRRLTAFDAAADGNVVATALLPLAGGATTFALGFGRTRAQAISTGNAAARRPFAATLAGYTAGWRAYDRTLAAPPPGGDRDAYRLSANVLKASEDKTFPGAIVA